MRSGTISMEMMRSAPSNRALWIANWPTGPAPPNRDCLSAFEVAEIRRHVAGRKDVGQEQDLLVAQSVRDLHRPYIGKRNAQIFGLAAVIAAAEVRIAEQSGRRIAPQLGGLGMVGIAAFATGVKTVLAKEAFAAGNRERDDDAVADLQFLVLGADRDDFAHILVAKHISRLHFGDAAAVDMKVGPADRAGGDFDDRISRMLNFRIGDRFAPDVAFAANALKSCSC
jgi:hypothetical protein